MLYERISLPSIEMEDFSVWVSKAPFRKRRRRSCSFVIIVLNRLGMVFFFSTEIDGREYELYMGRDKMENEDLLK